MNFQNERGLLADGAHVIGERRFVGRADLAQFCAARFQNLADAKASPDLDQFAARNDDFVLFLNEMANNQNERCCAIVHDCGRFRLAEHGESALEVASAVTAIAGRQIELQIII